MNFFQNSNHPGLHKTDLCRIKFLRHQGLAPTAHLVYYCVKNMSRIFFKSLTPAANHRLRRCVHRSSSIRNIAWPRFRRGRPVKAARYALRTPRGVVISLSLPRRNAASESEEKAVVRSSWLVARKSSSSFRIGHDQISQRAALAGSAPTLAPIGAFFTSRGLLEAMSSGLRPATGEKKGLVVARQALFFIH